MSRYHRLHPWSDEKSEKPHRALFVDLSNPRHVARHNVREREAKNPEVVRVTTAALQGAAQRINRVPNEQDRAVLNAPRNAGDHKMEALLKSSYGQQR